MDDVTLLRELAKRYAQIAARPENAEREHRARLVNGLAEARPLVWVDEVPWHELERSGELTLQCKGEREREMERFFRRKLYQWRHFQGDMVAEPFYRVQKSWESTGIGVQIEERRRSVDERNNIYSHGYMDQLDSMEALERLHAPMITAHPERDAENVAWAEDVLRGILPVRLTSGYLYCSPWDQIAMLRGIDEFY